MSEFLFPERALELLRKTRYDPDAQCELEWTSMSFRWSDEGMSPARQLCRIHGSDAAFYVMVFRTSLIKGEPIEEYRATWDQLRAQCPEWPGFRPERCSTQLLASWERAMKRLCIDLEREMREIEERGQQPQQP